MNKIMGRSIHLSMPQLDITMRLNLISKQDKKNMCIKNRSQRRKYQKKTLSQQKKRNQIKFFKDTGKHRE